MCRFLRFFLLVLVYNVVQGQSKSISDDEPEVHIENSPERSMSGSKTCDLGPEKCDTSETDLICMTIENGRSGTYRNVCTGPQRKGQSCDENLVSSEACQAGLSCQNVKEKYVCQPAEDAQFGPACDAEDRNWKLIYRHDRNGNPLGNTNFKVLKEAVRNGAELKVWTPVFGLMNIQKTTLCEDESCVQGQSMFWVNKVQRGTYNTFFVYSTTGNVHFTQFLTGGDVNAPRENSNFGAPEMKWFARMTSTSVDDTSHLWRTVMDGASLKVATKSGSIFRHIDVSSVSNNNVEGDSIWEMRDILDGREFNTTEQQVLTHWSVDDSAHNASWVYNRHDTVISESFENVGIDWFADSCWSFVYRHNGEGLVLSGSKSRLNDAIVDGKRIKVKVGSELYEANTIKITDGGEIIAQIYDSIEKNVELGTWKWMDISSTGEVKMYVVGLGGDSDVTMTTDNTMVTWFIENREWQKVNDDDDMNLIMTNVMDSGSDVRFSVRFADVTTWYQADVLSNFLGAFSEREVICDEDRCLQRYNFALWKTGNLEYIEFVVGTTEQVGHEIAVPNQLNWYIRP